MVEEELVELLTDYKSMAESEHNSFVSNLVNSNSNFSNLVFTSLQSLEERPKSADILPPLCDLLFNIYRRDPEYRYFAIQFLPHLSFIYILNYGDKEQFGCIETMLVGIHNIESAANFSFRIPGLGRNSVYHESSQITESRIQNSPPEVLGDKTGYTTVDRPAPPHIKSINSQNKLPTLAFLFNVYTGHMVEIGRQSVESTAKLCSRMVTRGFNIGGRKAHRRNLSYGSDPGMRSPRLLPNRIHLSSAILLEMLQMAYFAIFNSCFNAGLHLIRDIEFRGRHGSMDSVLLVSRALLSMAPKGPSVEEQRYISTPSQLSKNIITNASFRTKKLEGDIPRVEEEDGAGAGAEGGKMAIITEEGEDNAQEGKKSKDKDADNIADRIKAKMENVKFPMKNKIKERLSESEIVGKVAERKERRKEKKNAHDVDGLEEIRLQSVPSETIAIHSPESGSTSIF